VLTKLDASSRPWRARMDQNRRRLAHRIERERARLAKRILPAEATRHAPAPELEPRHLDGCRVLTDRDTMIREHLPKHAVVAEVGVDEGFNAHTILEGSKPRELHLIDRTFSRLRKDNVFKREFGDCRVRLHENDSVPALGTFPDEYFDWIYIDGDHSYWGVTRDIEAAQRKVKPGGLLVFNDYICFSHEELLRYGVVQAVNELCIAEGWTFRYLVLERTMYCDVALARPTGGGDQG
jgi:predicted O-methyltransferase YrrM